MLAERNIKMVKNIQPAEQNVAYPFVLPPKQVNGHLDIFNLNLVFPNKIRDFISDPQSGERGFSNGFYITEAFANLKRDISDIGARIYQHFNFKSATIGQKKNDGIGRHPFSRRQTLDFEHSQPH